MLQLIRKYTVDIQLTGQFNWLTLLPGYIASSSCTCDTSWLFCHYWTLRRLLEVVIKDGCYAVIFGWTLSKTIFRKAVVFKQCQVVNEGP